MFFDFFYHPFLYSSFFEKRSILVNTLCSSFSAYNLHFFYVYFSELVHFSIRSVFLYILYSHVFFSEKFFILYVFLFFLLILLCVSTFAILYFHLFFFKLLFFLEF